MKNKSAQGFTLVELLVVIAIIAILAAVVVLIMNPLEFTRRSRDAVRVTDLQNLNQAVNIAAQDATTSGVAVLCVGTSGAATPGTILCQGTSNSTSASNRNNDGTGWVKVNLNSQQSVSVPVLPVDPINDATNNYDYASDGQSWELNAAMESTQYAPKMTGDGGNSATQFEIGSTLTLL